MMEIFQLKKRYGKKQILQEVSFCAKPGECMAIIGSNGSGKSTLLQILAGVTRADAGEIIFFSQKPGRDRRIYRKFCGYVPQEDPLIPELSVRDNLRLWKQGRKTLSSHLLCDFELQEILELPVCKLSGGMKRRLSIACSVQNHPPILLLDEPTTALDLYYKSEIQKWLTDFQKKHGIIVMTTHDEKEIQMADRCLLMREGRLVELKKDDLILDQLMNSLH